MAVGVAVVIVAALAAVALYRRSASPPSPPSTPFVDIYDASLEIPSLVGQIIRVRSDDIEIDISSILGVPIPESSSLRHRTIITDTSTRLTREEDLSREAYAAALADYREKRARGERAVPPSPARDVPLAWSELKVGMSVRIVGRDGENIRAAPRILASEISVQH